jgi:PAS domain-containing protein
MAKRGKPTNDAADDLPLPIELPAAMFTGPGLLALADLLPVMTAYLDRDFKYRFINTPLAEWLERPRRELIGQTMRAVLGDQAFAERLPMLEAALRGERVFFASTFDHPTRGLLAAQSDYTPWIDPATGAVDGIVIVVTDITEQRLTEVAPRESEARFRRIADSAPAMLSATTRSRSSGWIRSIQSSVRASSRSQPGPQANSA